MDFREFKRDNIQPMQGFSFIGTGELGGKARGLFLMKEMLEEAFPTGEFEDIKVDIPQMVVIRSDIFDRFMEANHLLETALGSEDDSYIALEFQKASLPVEIVGDLMNLISSIRKPLAVRSSALLEDSLHEPFAGVYESKMVPNRSTDINVRFNQLTEAIKFVYSTLYFRKAKQYFKAIRKDIREEKMSVIIQEVVGDRYGDYFYPTIAGVIRSLNFYPSGNSRPENGIVQLALGLGKTIVDGGKAWCYSPRFPASPPPYNNIGDMLQNTQTDFWAINMGNITEFDPTTETEYLVQLELSEAEKAGNLNEVASTVSIDDVIMPGLSIEGPRLLDFAPILQYDRLPLNNLIKKILLKAEEKTEEKVEIEFAMRLPNESNPVSYLDSEKQDERAHFGFLQVRPLAVSSNIIDIDEKAFDKKDLLVQPDRALGNGETDAIRDIVFVKPEVFNVAESRTIAGEIDELNETLLDGERPYLLIGFGRWGTADPWLGIPVVWSQISGAKVIVETTLPQLNADFSQGSHFFHNVFSSGVYYFSVHDNQEKKIDWNWLKKQKTVRDMKYVRHVELAQPLTVKVDGRTGKGVILK
jgi:hypothetical protein